mmetsp:Transcript_3448/g.8021  ORF Transcript_3448/g.8021 Transcript_3448/m.8021 type:complete len:104 (+) Transcript_3448:2-313(+)
MRFVYEEDLFGNLPIKGDNYLLYATLLQLLQMASAVIDLRHEKYCNPPYRFESGEEGSVAFEDDAWELRGTCGASAKAKYKPRPLYVAPALTHQKNRTRPHPL